MQKELRHYSRKSNDNATKSSPIPKIIRAFVAIKSGEGAKKKVATNARIKNAWAANQAFLRIENPNLNRIPQSLLQFQQSFVHSWQ